MRQPFAMVRTIICTPCTPIDSTVGMVLALGASCCRGPSRG